MVYSLSPLLCANYLAFVSTVVESTTSVVSALTTVESVVVASVVEEPPHDVNITVTATIAIIFFMFCVVWFNNAFDKYYSILQP